MGVPALFRWLSRKYPKIISPVIEEDPVIVGDSEVPPQYSNPNPNGELDNLYLDMNGIVHPCSHPENRPPPETEADMMLEVFRYTDRVLNMARPRKLLMIAVDGVAPRAKMNQQRSRRFRSARDAQLANEEKERKMTEMESRGEIIDEFVKGKKTWDSNSITPGTPFMDILAESLKYWVSYKLATDPGWASLEVIISDATVPGEGEHKIMNFIRSQRSDPEFNPNTTHCIYGLDADLIFLGLATHEPHFKILREDVFAKDQAQRQLRAKDSLGMDEATKQRLEDMDKKKPFLWLHVSVLREYLEVELNIPRLPFKFDIERAIDDWIFMCFFVGNDFLPHLPSLDVRDNGIDILVNIWKRIIPTLRSYITCDGHLSLDGVEKLMAQLALQEDDIFRKRHEVEKRREDNDKRRRTDRHQQNAMKNVILKTVSKGKDNAPIMPSQNMSLVSLKTGEVSGGLKMNNSEIVHNISTISQANTANKSVADLLKQSLMKKPGESAASVINQVAEKSEPIDVAEQPQQGNNKKRTFSAEFASETSDEFGNDSINLWQAGYKTRYYEMKFQTTDAKEIERIRRDMAKCYVEGISWVLLYYYQGCPSWNWYYPYHYAPFAADFTDLEEFNVEFKLGTPFKPFEQLMSVLPAASGHNLPEVFRPLMSEPSSEIIDFYPEEFKIDMNGAKMSWQGIALLPFIDETRLLTAVRAKYPSLSEYEKERNTLKGEVLFVGKKNKNFKAFTRLYDEEDSGEEDKKTEIKFHCHLTGLAGKVTPSPVFDPKGTRNYKLDVESDEYNDIPNSTYMMVNYKMPAKLHGKSMLLTGYVSHLRVLTHQDKEQVMRGPGRFNRYNNKFETRNEIDYKPHIGKHGSSMYRLRAGGYEYFVDSYENEVKRQEQLKNAAVYQNHQYQQNQQYSNQQQYYNNYGGQGGRYNNYNNYNNNAGGGYQSNYRGNNNSDGYNNNAGGYNNRRSNNNGYNNNYRRY